jgi:hypothetical protein
LPEDLLILNDALDKLSEHDEIAADLIILCVFGGPTAQFSSIFAESS